MDTVLNWLSMVLLGLGTAFMLVAAVGVLRMPDLYLRLHCATKSVTLGIGCLMLGVAVYYNEPGVWLRALAVILFCMLTAPVGAHMIGRAAHRAGVPQTPETLSDALAKAEREGKT